MSIELLKLQSFDAEEFLEKHWQKTPCLIKQGLPNFESIISPEELAGLACENEVESRVITGEIKKNIWTLKEGPFDEEFFKKFPENNSTLLVQKVDFLVPEIALMRSLFSFIPTWRFDDVMISFAEDQGSVGPHVDNYDVFLLQAMGKRRWQLENGPIDSEENILLNCPLRVLNSFNPSLEWVLEPGDILYLPPRWAHHGVSLGRGMTYSFGFRSPALSDMLMNAAEHARLQYTEKERYADPDLKLMKNTSKIDQNLIDRVKNQLIKKIEQDLELHVWFGKLITSNVACPSDEDLHEYQQISLDEAKDFLRNEEGFLERSDDVKYAYHFEHHILDVFIHGHKISMNPEDLSFIETLFSQDCVSLKLIKPFLDDSKIRFNLLSEWIYNGYFRFR